MVLEFCCFLVFKDVPVIWVPSIAVYEFLSQTHLYLLEELITPLE